jgi:hypothetical protein
MAAKKSKTTKSEPSAQLDLLVDTPPTKHPSARKDSSLKLLKPPENDPASYVDAQYSGTKADLRPLYEKVVNLAMKLGKDVRVVPGKTIVPIYRKNVIAQVKAATPTRIDLGLALGKQRATGRLVDTGGYAKGDRITHRIPISTGADIDSEVKKWLTSAYELDTEKSGGKSK